MSLFINSLVLGQAANNVGINTSLPAATLDIFTKTNTSTSKALKINNSANLEMLTLLDNGNFAVNTPNPVAQLEVSSLNNTSSVLKLFNVSNNVARTNSNINYNQFSQLLVDESGNVMSNFNIRTNNSNAINFDGDYINLVGAANKKLLDINKGSILRFTVHTGFVQGAGGTGVVKYANITWSRGRGFQVNSVGYDFANNNPNTLTITGVGTNLIRFSVQFGDSLTFEVIGQELYYRQENLVDPSTSRAEGFRIIESFRSR